MRTYRTTVHVRGPWSLATSKRFWEGFSSNALRGQGGDLLHAAFRVERDWSRVEVDVQQEGADARLTLRGEGDLDGAAKQAARFLAIDVDGRGWPAVGERDTVVRYAQQQLPGLRPCGFYSPYEAEVWSVLAQRIRIVQAGKLRERLMADLGEDGAFPAPANLFDADLDLPGRKPEYLRAVAEAALNGLLDGTTLRAAPLEEALRQVQQLKAWGRSRPSWW